MIKLMPKEESFISKHLMPFKKFGEYNEHKNEKLLKFYPKEEQNRFRIMIRPTDFCNFSCDYCFSYSKNKENYLTIEQIDLLIDKVKNIPNKFYYIHGGEPFAYKNLFYLLDSICERKEQDTEVLIQTNLKLFKLEYINKFLEYHEKKLKIKLSVSVHQDINVQEYLTKFNLLYKHNLLNGIEIMYTKSKPKNLLVHKIFKGLFPDVISIYSIFNEMQTNIPNLDYRIDDCYKIETDKRDYDIQFDEFYKKGLNYSFKGMYCSAGNNGFLLNHDGKIFRCQANLFIYDSNFTTIENFDVNKLNKEKLCDNNICLCDLQYSRTTKD